MSNLKSPLRMPGGKSKVAELIASYFPEGITEMVYRTPVKEVLAMRGIN